jgi:PhnB protein
MQVIPILSFPGYAEEVLNFYKTNIGGQFDEIIRYKSLPGQEIPPEFVGKIRHVQLVFEGGGSVIIDDFLESLTGPKVQGTTISVLLAPTSEVKTREIFAKLSEGGKIISPIGKVFWNAIYGQFIDKYGVLWQLNFSLPNTEGDK